MSRFSTSIPSSQSALNNELGRNKVLSQTFSLLGLTLIPTIAAAMLGVFTGIHSIFNGIMGFLIYLAGAFGFVYMVTKNRENSKGIIWLMGFTFFMGLVVSKSIDFALGKGAVNAVASAFVATALTFFSMSVLAAKSKMNVDSWGPVLSVAGLVMIGVSLLNVFLFQSGPLQVFMSVAFSLLFTLFMFYDLRRIVSGGEDNYIMATMSLYINIIGLFQNLVHLFTGLSGDD